VGTLVFNWLSQLGTLIGELRGKSTHLGISAEDLPVIEPELHATARCRGGLYNIFDNFSNSQDLTW